MNAGLRQTQGWLHANSSRLLYNKQIPPNAGRGALEPSIDDLTRDELGMVASPDESAPAEADDA